MRPPPPLVLCGTVAALTTCMLLLQLARPTLAGECFDSHEPVQMPPCNLGNCFDADRCRAGFTLYVYPPPADDAVLASPTCRASLLFGYAGEEEHLYQSCFLRTLLGSGLPVTANASSACLLVPSLDANCAFNTCGRGELQELGQRLASLPHWGAHGLNHLLFNVNNDFLSHDFDAGRAMVARASWVRGPLRYRDGFGEQRGVCFVPWCHGIACIGGWECGCMEEGIKPCLKQVPWLVMERAPCTLLSCEHLDVRSPSGRHARSQQPPSMQAGKGPALPGPAACARAHPPPARTHV